MKINYLKNVHFVFVFFAFYCFSLPSQGMEEGSSVKLCNSKVALVTGGSRGIGKALVEELLLKGLKVIAVARDVQSLGDLAKNKAGRLQLLAADLSTVAGQDSVASKVACENIDFLVHNAAVITPLGDSAFLEAEGDSIRRILNLNIMAPAILNLALADKLRPGSRVLMISSRAGDGPSPGTGFYSTTKAWVDRYALSGQQDKPHSVLFAAVNPGDVDTDMHGDLRAEDPSSFPRTLHFREIREQLLSVETSARFLRWLLTETESAYYTSRKHTIYDSSTWHYWNNGNSVLSPSVSKNSEPSTSSQ
jgi:benzil reductase ((S)-benzoin forming)